MTDKAKKILDGLSEKANQGLLLPVGNYTDLSFKNIIELFDNEDDRKWARIQIRRTKDISAITTSLFLVVILDNIFFAIL